MSGIATAVVAGAVITSSQQKKAASEAADKAAAAQTESAEAGISEQQRQFDAVKELLKPYVDTGTSSMTAQKNLIGLGGDSAQQTALQGLQNSPQFAAITQQGENALLQNASATGGLRGGNLQAALAQFRPQVLSQLIDQQYGRYGQLSQLGQAAAAGQASAGMQTGTNISNMLGQIGQAQAGSALAKGQATSNMWGSIGSAFGSAMGSKF